MGTHSTISIKREIGTIISIYCHWDGHLEGVGATLLTYYNTPEVIEHLISLGSVSSLGSNIEPFNPMSHSFNNPEENTTVFYSRDRGEPLRITYYDSFDEWIKADGEGYDYLFTDGVWVYKDHGSFVGGLIK